jgi:tRNA (cytidine32/uridine32-2'-O)-methyltransferase
VAGARAVREAQGGGEIALVFGRERTGLSNDEYELCHAAVHIPANPDYSSLNLAMAVQVLSYEVRLAALAAVPAALGEGERQEPPASHADGASSPSSQTR